MYVTGAGRYRQCREEAEGASRGETFGGQPVQKREDRAEGEEDGVTRSEMKKRKERKRTSEATRRNGYEEIPPPVIPP